MTTKNVNKRVALLIVISFLLASCAVNSHRSEMEKQITSSGMTSENLQINTLVLRALSKISAPVNILRVYIEGDGFAWINRSTPSADPTPRNPVALKLAMADPAANVLYLARPCQFAASPLPAGCNLHWWTDRRFSSQAVDVMNDALTQFVQRYPGVQLELVGYSGGGNIAALLAARRGDVRSLRTVAGNLDVAYVNALHRVSPMPQALSAIDVAPQLAALPQVHFTGAQDTTVPASVAKRYQQAADSRCVKVIEVPGMDHGSDWAARWPALLTSPPDCH